MFCAVFQRTQNNTAKELSWDSSTVLEKSVILFLGPFLGSKSIRRHPEGGGPASRVPLSQQ